MSQHPATVAPPLSVHIAARRPLQLNLRELWDYRELLYFFVWRDVKVRYKQTLIGASWAIIQPLMTMVVFSLFFGRLAQMPSDGLPYPLFSLAGLVPWTYFATAVSAGGASVVTQQQLISKVYFPRVLAPLSAVITPLVDMGVALAVLAALAVWYGVAPSLNLIALPIFILLAAGTSFAAALWLSALHVRYRDVRFVLPFLVQLWLFASPVAYPASLVPDAWRPVYALNPMVGVLEGFRWAVLGSPPPGQELLVSCVVVVIALGSGFAFFRHLERTLADHV